MTAGGYRVRELTADECETIAGWRYDGRLATYDFAGSAPDPADGYFAIEDADGSFVGYCCYGAEARVPGLEPEPGVLDLGVGLAPEHVGEGRSRSLLEAVLAHGDALYEPERFRAAVLDWNERSLAACRNAGFEEVGDVTDGVRRFVVVERPA